MNTEFSARKGVQVLLWAAEGARSTPLSSDLSKRSRTSEEHWGWACFRRFPPGSGRGTGSDGAAALGRHPVVSGEAEDGAAIPRGQ